MTPIAVAIADFHWTFSVPRCRKDEDIRNTLHHKLLHVVNKANELDVPLISAGDFFDTWKCSHETVNFAISVLRELERPFLAVFGQHELPYHDYLRKMESPLTTVLQACGKDLVNKAYTLHLTDQDSQEVVVNFYGLSWREKRSGGPASPKAINVLVQHKLVWENRAPFATEEQGDVCKLIKEDPYKHFDAVVTGDNHVSFLHTAKDIIWINCGCVFRTSAAEKLYAPCYWVLYVDDAGKVSCEVHGIPFKKNLVSTEHIEEQKEKELKHSKFIKNLEVSPLTFDYGETVTHLMKKKQIGDGVRHKVEKALDEARLTLASKRRIRKGSKWLR